MGVDVSRAQFAREQLGQRALGVIGTEVHHDGDVGQRSSLDGVLDRRPFRTCVVRRLDPDNRAPILAGHLGRRRRLHVALILFERAAAHPMADDVQEREDACFGATDDAIVEVLEVAPARASRIGHRRDARAEGETVRVDAVVAGVRLLLPGAGVDVGVDVNESWRDIQAGHVNGHRGLFRIDVRRHGSDLAVFDGDVAYRVYPVPRVDEMAAPEEHVVRRLGLLCVSRRCTRPTAEHEYEHEDDGRFESRGRTLSVRSARRPLVPCGGPGRTQVLAHIEGSGHVVARDRP